VIGFRKGLWRYLPQDECIAIADLPQSGLCPRAPQRDPIELRRRFRGSYGAMQHWDVGIGPLAPTGVPQGVEHGLTDAGSETNDLFGGVVAE
jgi:hypothetical protein